MAMVFTSCHERLSNTNKETTIESFSKMKSGSYIIKSHRIRKYIDDIIRLDSDSALSDYKTRSYYLNKCSFLWIDRHGIDSRADSLITYLRTVKDMGFSIKSFYVDEISEDLIKVRSLNFNKHNNINYVLAHLEYNLTKAYLRYVYGQRFGFTNPLYLYNHLDVKDSDSLRVTYRTLFDLQIERPTKSFCHDALAKIYNDSISAFLHEIQPTNPLYYHFLSIIRKNKFSLVEKNKYLCNLERCRWRLKDYPQNHNKYVLVNIPSLHLLGIDGDKVLSMRIGCGSSDTKTPLLSSYIKRMDINPNWIIPHSIIKKTIIRHLGNETYFNRNHFYIRERKTGKKMRLYNVTRDMLLNSNDYLVIQEGGEGNSLGRIIFRFDNKFSVFLHDTSNKGIFSKEERDVSHGCIRIEKPFDLAVFLMKKKDEDIIDKLKYSMTVSVNKYDDCTPNENIDRKRMIGSYFVNPAIPIFIIYYTLYPDPYGKLQEYSDIYGYDKVLSKAIAMYYT
jgi:murein L,D-transpeptidase YcbB/YkuD